MPRTNWPPYQTMRPLIHAHAGRAAAIMGGGPSLSEGFAKVPAGAVLFSVNDHGYRHFKAHPHNARPIDYIVACDKIEDRVGKFPAPRISRHMWADYRLLFMPGTNSAMAAAWCARLMGCGPIVLLGIDLYAGETYHDDPKGRSSGKNLKPGIHAQNWAKFFQQFPAQYRAIGGHPSLTKYVGQFDGKELGGPPLPREVLSRELRGSRVWIKLDSIVSMRPFYVGTQLELNEHEAIKLVKQHRAIRLQALP